MRRPMLTITLQSIPLPNNPSIPPCRAQGGTLNGRRCRVYRGASSGTSTAQHTSLAFEHVYRQARKDCSLPPSAWTALPPCTQPSTMERCVYCMCGTSRQRGSTELAELYRLHDEWLMEHWPFATDKQRARLPFTMLAGFGTWCMLVETLPPISS